MMGRETFAVALQVDKQLLVLNVNSDQHFSHVSCKLFSPCTIQSIRTESEAACNERIHDRFTFFNSGAEHENHDQLP